MAFRNRFRAQAPAPPPADDPGPQEPEVEGRAPAGTGERADVFVARQPVFTASLSVDAYELVFRPSTVDSLFADVDASLATSRVISVGLGTMGWDALTGGRRALIPASREVLLGDQLQLLPAATTILGVRESSVDEPLVDACRRLRAAGYALAVDDVTAWAGDGALLGLASFVRFDAATARTDRLAPLRRRDVRLIAANIESREHFALAKAPECSHFQGIFFSRPAIVAGRETAGFVGNYQQLLAEIAREEANFARLEQIIKQDLSLSYKFLSFINSAAFGWSRRITSLRQALVLLGQEQLRRWVALTAVASAVDGKPQELAVDAVVRAVLRVARRTAGARRLWAGPVHAGAVLDDRRRARPAAVRGGGTDPHVAGRPLRPARDAGNLAGRPRPGGCLLPGQLDRPRRRGRPARAPRGRTARPLRRGAGLGRRGLRCTDRDGRLRFLPPFCPFVLKLVTLRDDEEGVISEGGLLRHATRAQRAPGGANLILAIRDRMEKRDEGFTLIELLVVVIIIGILAAIAIPVFLKQRERGWAASAESDARNAAIHVETSFTQNPSGGYTSSTGAGNGSLVDFKPSNGVTTTVFVPADGKSYCVKSKHANNEDADTVWLNSNSLLVRQAAAPSGCAAA